MSVRFFLNKYLPHTLKVLQKLLRGKIQYNQDGIITTHNAEFMKESLFKSYYDNAVGLGLSVDPKIHWRSHVINWAGEQCKSLEGDYVEAGVNKGFLSRVMVDYIDFEKTDKTLYLLDTFNGLVPTQLTEAEVLNGANAQTYEDCYKLVKEVFNYYKNVRIVRGVIPNTLKQVKSSKIAFLSIDLNCAYPEIATIKYFWNKLVKGAIVVLDDYGWSGHEEQKKAFDKFATSKGIKILSLPTGQGVIIK